MNTALKRHGVNLLPGTVIKGRWHHNEYRIIKKIGEGLVGTVYLTKGKNRYLALKMSKQSASITMEVNVLKTLQKVQGKRLGPLLMDVDDFEVKEGMSYSFYVMEYVKGENLRKFIQKNGSDWLGAFLFQVLDQLEALHNLGYAFGDLKVDHLIVEPTPPRVRLIDFGGATKQGRAIKEFTEFYDRGYWGLGSRRAEPSYDLFSLVLVVLHLFYPNEFKKGVDPKRTLFNKLKGARELSAYEQVLKSALLGQFKTAKDMARDLQRAIYEHGRKSYRNQIDKKSNGMKPFITEVGILSFIVALYSYFAFFYP